MTECPDCGATDTKVHGFACQHERCPMFHEVHGRRLPTGFGWINSATAKGSQMTPAQKAYGALWRELTARSPLINEARRQLRESLTKEEQREAVAWSVQAFGPVSDSEAIAADMQAGVFPSRTLSKDGVP